MKEDNNSQRLPVNPFSRFPQNPFSRIPMNPINRFPQNPFSRMSGNSGRFFEDFTTAKNTETNWNAKGFSKKVR